MKSKLMMAAAILFAAGCVDTTNDSGKDGPVGGGDPSFSVTWGGSAVSLTITNGSSTGDYFFGMAETGATCANDPDQCWTGEDCFAGFGSNNYCHPASSTGVSLNYGADPASVNAGVNTVFGNNSFDGSVTYYVDDLDGGQCWVGGDNPSYYSTLGCDSASF